MTDDWNRKRAEVDIAEFKNAVEDSSIEEVETPSGRKDVEIAWENDEQGFCVEDGVAVGVYYDPNRRHPQTVHIDWVDGQERTSVEWDNIVTFEEGEYNV